MNSNARKQRKRSISLTYYSLSHNLYVAMKDTTSTSFMQMIQITSKIQLHIYIDWCYLLYLFQDLNDMRQRLSVAVNRSMKENTAETAKTVSFVTPFILGISDGTSTPANRSLRKTNNQAIEH